VTDLRALNVLAHGLVANMKPWVLLIATSLVATVCLAQCLPRGEQDSQGGIPFQVNKNFGAILIRADVNGRPATLVVDTGSSHTILSSELLQVRALALEHANTPAKGSGYVGTAGWTKATLEIGTITWRDRRVLVMDDFQDLSSSMKQRVDGIIGEDVLREFSVVVLDFKRCRLVLSR
jgi:predicted aspartyl protease